MTATVRAMRTALRLGLTRGLPAALVLAHALTPTIVAMAHAVEGSDHGPGSAVRAEAAPPGDGSSDPHSHHGPVCLECQALGAVASPSAAPSFRAPPTHGVTSAAPVEALHPFAAAYPPPARAPPLPS